MYESKFSSELICFRSISPRLAQASQSERKIWRLHLTRLIRDTKTDIDFVFASVIQRTLRICLGTASKKLRRM